MIALYLRRGMAAGLLAGLLAGLFAFVIGEPLLDQAIGLEHSAHTHEGEEVFSRSTQKVGLFFATGFTGVFIRRAVRAGVRVLPRSPGFRGDWTRSLSLAAAIFAGAADPSSSTRPILPRSESPPRSEPARPTPTSRWSGSRCWRS